MLDKSINEAVFEKKIQDIQLIMSGTDKCHLLLSKTVKNYEKIQILMLGDLLKVKIANFTPK